jgi:hypothetical protein
LRRRTTEQPWKRFNQGCGGSAVGRGKNDHRPDLGGDVVGVRILAADRPIDRATWQWRLPPSDSELPEEIYVRAEYRRIAEDRRCVEPSPALPREIAMQAVKTCLSESLSLGRPYSSDSIDAETSYHFVQQL